MFLLSQANRLACIRRLKVLIPQYIHDPGKRFNDILVPTIDTVRTEWLLNLMHAVKRSTLLVGESGTSKTATALSFLRKLNPDIKVILGVNFSSRTTSMDVQRKIESIVLRNEQKIRLVHHQTKSLLSLLMAWICHAWTAMVHSSP